MKRECTECGTKIDPSASTGLCFECYVESNRYTPTPEQIREACLEEQKKWPPERLIYGKFRGIGETKPWTPPTCREGR